MTTKYEIEFFNGKNDFSLWRVKIRAVLVQQGLLKALNGKQALPESMSDEDKDDLLERAHSAIQLSLSDEVLREVAEETSAASLWLRLESFPVIGRSARTLTHIFPFLRKPRWNCPIVARRAASMARYERRPALEL
ncbi:hypothetical protein Patl1_37449 [Pistacia atlantica]|nr:hypothetical protein Patl1_37449 [Pistacia atlantica]